MIDLALYHLQTRADVAKYLELIRKIWPKEPGVARLAKNLIDNHPKMSLNNFYVIKEKGRMVSTLCLIPALWSMGGVKLKVAEMGIVGTLSECRCRGLVRLLVNEYHKDVQKRGYDLSVIEGISYFYRQFGYDYAIPLLEEIKIRIDQIPEFKTTLKIRSFTEDDIPKAREFLEKSQAKFCVHSMRNGGIWKMQQESGMASDAEPFLSYVVEERGKPVAYFRVREVEKDKRLLLVEISDVNQVQAQAVLIFLKQRANKFRLENLSSTVSYEEPFNRYLMSLGATKSLPTYAWQIRVTDYEDFFRKLKPLFERRLADSMYRELTETLNFNFRRFAIQVTVKNGKIADIRKTSNTDWSPIGLNPTAFVQLLTGHRSRQQLEEVVPDIRIAQSHRNLMDTLFPKMPSYIHPVY